MRSKLLQPIRKSHEEVNRKRENTEGASMPWRARENPPGRVSPPVEASDHKDSPGLVQHHQFR
jgi:hypothetical protein